MCVCMREGEDVEDISGIKVTSVLCTDLEKSSGKCEVCSAGRGITL